VSTNLASSDTDVVDDEGAEPKKGDRHSDYNTLTGPLKPNMASSEENVRNELKTTAHANEGKSKMEAICIDWTEPPNINGPDHGSQTLNCRLQVV